MDLSWEICEAFTRLGFLPPLHFAGDLPDMSGALTSGHVTVLDAAARSCEIAASWATQSAERVTRLRAQMSRRAIGPANDRIPDYEMEIATMIADFARNGGDTDRLDILGALAARHHAE